MELDFYDFLRQFIALDVLHVATVAIVVGGAVFGFIQGLDVIARNRPPGGVGLNPNWKFWLALGLCILIPFGAYVLVTTNDTRPLTIGGVALAAGVSFLAATGLHWVTGGAQKAQTAHNLEKVAADNRVLTTTRGQ